MTTAVQDFKVADMSQATFGRKEIILAEHEMPGLMATRREFGSSKPLAGATVMGSLHMTIQTAVLIETLKDLGADLRWCSCNIFSTQDVEGIATGQSGEDVIVLPISLIDSSRGYCNGSVARAISITTGQHSTAPFDCSTGIVEDLLASHHVHSCAIRLREFDDIARKNSVRGSGSKTGQRQGLDHGVFVGDIGAIRSCSRQRAATTTR